MQPSLRDSESARKGKSEDKSARLPGSELAAVVRQGHRNGRPVWRVPLMVAPRIEEIAIWDQATGEAALVQSPMLWRDPDSYLEEHGQSTRVLLYLRTLEPSALKQLQYHDRVQLRCLVAAALRDISGCHFSDIGEALGWKNGRKLGYQDGHADGYKSVRRDISAGRRLWWYLGAWPWGFWPEQEPPDAWAESGADPVLAAALQTWATGEPVVAPEESARIASI